MSDPLADPKARHGVVERVREACIQEALRAYEQAGISGLCHEGRFEAAVSAMRMVDLADIGCNDTPAS